MYKEFNIVNSYTLECSLCGPSIGSRKEYHYSKKMLFVRHQNFDLITLIGYGKIILRGFDGNDRLGQM
jgi:hypothetical protein